MSRELRRRDIQTQLDSERTGTERNKDGQFATPPVLAGVITDYALGLLPEKRKVRVLEPSCGSGAFVSAVVEALPSDRRDIVGVEMDPRFAKAARDLWGDDARIVQDDYLSWVLADGERFDLLVANPPYVRHHHMTAQQKQDRNNLAARASGTKVSKLAGLYVYFMLASQLRLADGGVATWLVPSEFMTVNYGEALREFLSGKVTTVRIHTFSAEDGQFDDALVTSCVVTYRNERPSEGHTIRLTTGPDYTNPSVSADIPVTAFRVEKKWPRLFPNAHVEDAATHRLGDFFAARRGIATGNNKFFIHDRRSLLAEGITERFLTPILPSPRDLKAECVEANSDGWPDLPQQLALIDCTVPLEGLRELDPALHERLANAPGDVTSGYLVKGRKPWYRQERRDGPPIVCTYMGRATDDSAPFRFIRNRTRATVTNAYLGLFPTDAFTNAVTDLDAALDVAWHSLGELTAATLMHSGREYGGGLQKMEPKELASLPADRIVSSLRAAGLWRVTADDAGEPVAGGQQLMMSA